MGWYDLKNMQSMILSGKKTSFIVFVFINYYQLHNNNIIIMIYVIPILLYYYKSKSSKAMRR